MRTAPHQSGYAGREVTQPPNWHGLVAWDFFFNAITTGLFFVTAVGELVRPAELAGLAEWAYPLALLFLLADLTCLVFDLGNPARFHHMLRVFKPTSPMSLGTWFLTGYSLPLAALVGLDVAIRAGWLPPDSAAVGTIRGVLLVVGLPLAFGSAAYKGVLFSTTAQPGWRDARWLGAYHTTGALAVGGAGLLLLAALTGDARAAESLRLPVGVLATVNLVALVLLAVDLRLARVRAYRGGRIQAAAVAVVIAAVLAPGLILVGGRPAMALGSFVLLALGLTVRSLVVLLPHAIRSRAGPI